GGWTCRWTVDGERHRYRSRPTRPGRVCRGSSLQSFLPPLLAEDPANDLLSVEDQPAARRGPEAGQSFGDERLSYGPRRTADERGHSANVERCAKLLGRLRAPGFCSGQLYPGDIVDSVWKSAAHRVQSKSN